MNKNSFGKVVFALAAALVLPLAAQLDAVEILQRPSQVDTKLARFSVGRGYDRGQGWRGGGHRGYGWRSGSRYNSGDYVGRYSSRPSYWRSHRALPRYYDNYTYYRYPGTWGYGRDDGYYLRHYPHHGYRGGVYFYSR